VNKTIQEWALETTPSDDMLWKGAWGAQIKFIGDTLQELIGVGLEHEERRKLARVISTHVSKSILLPVVEIARPDLGVRFILRENFYNWKLSVISERPVEANFDGLFPITPPTEPDYTGNPLSPVYFEGFPADLIFGYFEPSDRRRWSAEIWSEHVLWTTIFLVLKAVGGIKPHVWTTRESHRAALEARNG
jgi:hypothetical protein